MNSDDTKPKEMPDPPPEAALTEKDITEARLAGARAAWGYTTSKPDRRPWYESMGLRPSTPTARLARFRKRRAEVIGWIEALELKLQELESPDEDQQQERRNRRSAVGVKYYLTEHRRELKTIEREIRYLEELEDKLSERRSRNRTELAGIFGALAGLGGAIAAILALLH